MDETPLDEMIELDEALKRLAIDDREMADVVNLRYFAGLSVEETSKVLGVSVPTVKRRWRYARAWLHKELRQGDDSGAVM